MNPEQLTNQNLIDWSEILPPTAIVFYSSLAVPDAERDSLNRDVAEMKFASGVLVDIEWNEEIKMYVVSVSTEEYENSMIQLVCRSANDVIEEVKRLSVA